MRRCDPDHSRYPRSARRCSMISCSSEEYSNGLAMRSFEELFGAVVAGRSEAGCRRPGVRREPTIGLPSMWAGIGRPRRARIVGVTSIRWALRLRPGGRPAPARATIPSGRWVPGRLASGSTQARARRQLGADPVGLIGQRDQVGISLAGRVDLIGLGGLDDLGKEPGAGFGVLGVGECLRRRRCGRRRSAGASCAVRRF